MQFTFDRIFGCNADNNMIFEGSTKELIQKLMNGCNCSIFVYGATGAGKTHTMLGHETDPGITFLTMIELFKQKQQLIEEREFDISITYLEVYNETIRDLLNPGPPLQLREDKKYGVIVAGIRVHCIKESKRLFELLEQGNRSRTQHPTDANAESSRSHAVFQVYLRMKSKCTSEVRIAKLSMIDLAGSERGAATGCSGARFTEGANINKSLLALGNCINSLAGGRRHIPYRDSKLTRLLKDSLGGNCRTVMVANVSPTFFNYEDTYNTLKYASRAKKIKSNIKKNVTNCEENTNYYTKLVDDLTKENNDLKLELSLLQKNTENRFIKEEHRKELLVLYVEKQQLENQILQLKNTKDLLQLKKQFKVELNAKLSIIFKGAKQLHFYSAVGSSLEVQCATLQKDILNLVEKNESIKQKITTFLENHPQLKTEAVIEDNKIDHLNLVSKVENLQKIHNLQSQELQLRNQLIERLLCFYGENITFQELMQRLKHLYSITWDDENMSNFNVYSYPRNSETVKSLKNIYSEESLNCNSTFSVSKIEHAIVEQPIQKAHGTSSDSGCKLSETFILSSDRLSSPKLKRLRQKDCKRSPNAILNEVSQKENVFSNSYDVPKFNLQAISNQNTKSNNSNLKKSPLTSSTIPNLKHCTQKKNYR